MAENGFPLSAIPGGGEAGLLGAAVVMALIDLLIERKAITRGEVVFLLQSLTERLSQDPRALSKQAADILGNWVRLHEEKL